MTEQRVAVIVQDEDTGEVLSAMHMAPDSDYVITCGPNYTLAHEQHFANGTTQLTIKPLTEEGS